MSSRTLNQSMDALNRANNIRIRRAEEFRKVKAMPPIEGRAIVAKLVLERPDYVRTLSVHKILCWPRWSGDAYAASILSKERISGHKPLESLTDRQARAIALRLAADAVPGEPS